MNSWQFFPLSHLKMLVLDLRWIHWKLQREEGRGEVVTSRKEGIFKKANVGDIYLNSLAVRGAGWHGLPGWERRWMVSREPGSCSSKGARWGLSWPSWPCMNVGGWTGSPERNAYSLTLADLLRQRWARIQWKGTWNGTLPLQLCDLRGMTGLSDLSCIWEMKKITSAKQDLCGS